MNIIPTARNSDPETSHIAAASMAGIATSHTERILAALKSFGPQSIYEIAERTGLDHVGVARRMKDIERAKGAERVPSTVRLSPNGRPCTVWRAAA
jgi:predicted ArsR family transcriptional regulator